MTLKKQTPQSKIWRKTVLKQFDEMKRKYQAGEIILSPYQQEWAERIAAGESYLRDVPVGAGRTLIAVRVQELLESEHNVSVTITGLNDDD